MKALRYNCTRLAAFMLLFSFFISPVSVFAGENLIQNGTFEGAAPATGWGGYANSGGFSCAHWTFHQSDRSGLAKPNGTWMASGLAVGTYACFLQASTKDVTVSQTIPSVPAGNYRLTFKYTARPGYNPGVVEAWLGDVQIGSRISTTATSLQTFSQDFTFAGGDNVVFKFYSPNQNADRAVVVEAAVLCRLEATIGTENYLDFADAMRNAAATNTIIYATAGNDAVFSGTYTWNGNLPKVSVPGVCNVQGTVTVVANGCTTGTYTLLEAGSFNFETGASFVLDTSVTDRFERTLAVNGNTLVLTVAARDPATVTEYVVNGDFDIPGCQYGNNGANTWGYTFSSAGFALPGWTCFSQNLNNFGIGLSAANGTWLTTGQTNGGVLSLYMQGQDDCISQEFGEIPAGIYRCTFNYAGRPSHLYTVINADVLRNGSSAYTFKTPVINNTAFAQLGAVVSLPAAGATGIKFSHLHPDTADRAAVLDDISFRREAIIGWSLTNGTTLIAGAASVPVYSYVDGHASFAADATPTFAVNSLQAPTLTVKNTFTVNGTVTLSVTGTADLTEMDYVLIDAANISFGDGASLALDPNATFKNDGTTYFYRGWLVVTDKQVILRIRNYNTGGTNNYLAPEDERTDTLFSTVGSWSRGHTPDSTDANVIFNYPGTVTFDSLVSIVKPWYFRNGLEVPLVFDATEDAYGFTVSGNNTYLLGCGGTYTAFVEFRKGTYSGYNLLANGDNNVGANSKGRIDFTGATVSLANCLQCGYSVDAQSWINITGGSVTLFSGYNGNIQARTYNKFRMSGGTFTVPIIQLLAGAHSFFDGELSGGDIYVSNNFRIGYGNTGATGRFVLSGGTLHLNSLTTQPATGCEAMLLASGGVLAPYSATTTWMNGGTVTAPVGGTVILDTDGFDVTLIATLVDLEGGNAYGITKRGQGTLTLMGEQTLTGALKIEGGTLAAPVAFAASQLQLDSGATYSVANGVSAPQALPPLVLAGGARLAIDVDATTNDVLTATSIDLSGASAGNQVVIDVDLIGLTELESGKEYPILTGGLATSDAAKFTVAGVDSQVKVENGTLYLLASSRVKVAVEWSGAANDGGSWTTGDNWTGGVAPQNGDTAVFNLGAGGTTLFDITGLAVGGIRFGVDAGAFTHTGTDMLKVTGPITNLSSAAQTFEMPLTLGVRRQSVEINSSGTTIITGTVTTAASTLVKKGAGVLGMRDTAVLSAASVVIEEGTLRIDERTGDFTSSRLVPVPLTTTDQIIWRNVNLSEMTGVTGLAIGQAIGGIGAPYTTYFWQNDGSSATAQFQLWDGTYTKCVCATFTQIGSDVAARATRACYSNSGVNVLGQDMSTGYNDQPISSASNMAGYGVTSVRPILADGTEFNTITVLNGGALDVNASGTGATDVRIAEPVHGKKLKIQGTGPDGKGALYNSAPYSNWGAFLGEVELTGDAKVGGSHLSLRALPGSACYQTSLTGPYTLEIASGGAGANNYFNICAAALDVAQIDVTGYLQIEGVNTGVVSNGFRFADGSTFRSYATTVCTNMPIHFNAGATVSVLADGGGDTHVYSPSSIGEGGTVNVTGAKSLVFHNAFTNEGTLTASAATTQFWGPSLEGGNYVANGALGFGGQINSPSSEITLSGAGTLYIGASVNTPLAGYPKLASITSTATGDVYFLPGISDEIDGPLFDDVVANGRHIYMQSDSDTTTTLKNCTWNEGHSFFLAHNNKYGSLVLDEGAHLTIPSVFYIQDGAQPKNASVTIKTGASLNFTQSNNGFQLARVWQNHTKTANGVTVNVDGGSIFASGMTALVGTGGGNAWFNINDGLVQLKQFDVHHSTQFASSWRDLYDACVSLKGGTLELGAGGFQTAWPSLGKVHADLANGTLKAAGNIANKYAHSVPTFGASPVKGAQHLTFDLNDKAVTWNAPLAGGTELTITGGGSFASTVNLQSIPVGHWTVTNTTSVVGLQGAAGFAGGLTLAPGTSARVDIAGEGLVEWGLFNTVQFANIDAMLDYDGPLPFTANAMRELNTSWTSDGGKKPGNHTLLCYRGEFEVKSDQAGIWYFAGNTDDNISLVIDGENIFKTTGWTMVGTGSKELTAGWHTFKICTLDATGASGPAQADWKNCGMAVGWTLDASKSGSVNHADYTRFDTDQVPMRLAAGERSRTSVRVRVKGDNNTTERPFDSEDIMFNAYDFVTNTMDVVNSYNLFPLGKSGILRIDGYFYVPKTNEGEWSFTVQYDDNITFKIDGVQVAKSTSHNVSQVGKCILAEGWHRFSVAVYDGLGSWGGMMTDDDNVRCAIRVVMPGDAKKYAFNGNNFRIAANALGAARAAEMAGLGGVTTLGAGSTLANDTTRGSCPIYGTLEGSGALSGAFAFKGAKSTLKLKGRLGRLTEKPDFTGVTDNGYLKGLTRIDAVFVEEKAVAACYVVGPAGSLTPEEAAAILVTVKNPDDEVVTDWTATVANGNLVLNNPRPNGTLIIFR